MSKVSGGGMAAVIGLDSDSIEGVLLSEGADQIDLANYNSPGQIVISGDEAQIFNVLAPLKEAGARMVVPLKVSGAFHSRLMMDSANEFAEFIAKFSIIRHFRCSIKSISNYNIYGTIFNGSD